jgi:hypothetical protein
MGRWARLDWGLWTMLAGVGSGQWAVGSARPTLGVGGVDFVWGGDMGIKIKKSCPSLVAYSAGEYHESYSS